MGQIKLKYPNKKLLEELLSYSPNMKVYKHFDENDNLLQQFELRNGTWYDVTERERAKLELEKVKQELDKKQIDYDDVIGFAECEE